MEVLKDIEGFEGIYEVSDYGYIRSVDRYYFDKNGKRFFEKGKIMSVNGNNSGYPLVHLRKQGQKRKAVLLYRVVAIYHVPNPHNLPEVNHGDGNKFNCAAWNLNWTSSSGNKQHAIANDLFPLKGKHYKAKPVLDLNTGIFYDCVEDAAFSRNMTRYYLKDRLNGHTKNNTSFIYA